MLDQYGLDDRVRALAAPVIGDAPPGLSPGATPRFRRLGRVIRIDRGAFQVVTDTDPEPVAATLCGALKDAPEPEDRPAIGDWVVLDDENTIEVVLERRSAFRRGDAERLQAQVVAANVDTVFLVHSADDEPNLRRLERELALAFESGAEPVVVVTKSDLAADARLVVAVLTKGAPGVDLLVTSAVTGEGLDSLTALIAGRTAAFIGKSGVGKSSLVNALLDDEAQSVGAIRASDGRGRHTTSHREMFLLPGGGVLVDTPGLRSIGMWQSDDGIARVFADIEELAVNCRFRDCAHEHEPGCAVLDAVRAGTIDESRVRNYRTMLAELDQLDRESELRSRLEKKRHAKILSKAVRAAHRKPRD